MIDNFVFGLLQFHYAWATRLIQSEKLMNSLYLDGKLTGLMQVSVSLTDDLLVPPDQWEKDRTTPFTAPTRVIHAPSVYIYDNKVRNSLLMAGDLRAQSTWALTWTKVELLEGGAGGGSKPIDGSIVVHTTRTCCNIKDPRPLLLHAMAIKKVNWCAHCVHKQGTLFQVYSPPVPPHLQHGDKNGPPMFTCDKTTGLPWGHPDRVVLPGPDSGTGGTVASSSF